MKILWLTNIPLPEVSRLLNQKLNPFGGWMVNTAEALAREERIDLSIAFPQKYDKGVRIIVGERINYYSFNPINKNNKNKELEEIIISVKPDIVHIFGTEYLHTLSMIEICNKYEIKSVINIQGLVSICTKHYMNGIPSRIQNRFTFRDFIKQDNITQQSKKFLKRGKNEIQAIKKVKNVIGRTTWDKACIKQINPNIRYYFCNEILREEFYNHKWTIENCEKYSIFISQATYPIKGLHFMFEAMPIILNKFPEVKLYIAGEDIFKGNILKGKIRESSYVKYLRELINKYNLRESIVFTGLLDEKQMCERFLKSNVFVSCSTIENESNSLSEAKLLGVPSIASYVGGVTDRITNNEDGFLYQADAPYMLAYYVNKIFEDQSLAKKFSNNSRKKALIINNRADNLDKLIRIYKSIINQEDN